MDTEDTKDKVIRRRVWVELPERTLKKLQIKAIETDSSLELLVSAILRAAMED